MGDQSTAAGLSNFETGRIPDLNTADNDHHAILADRVILTGTDVPTADDGDCSR